MTWAAVAGASISTSATTYVSPLGGNSAEANVQLPMAQSGQVLALYCQGQGAPGILGTYWVDFRKATAGNFGGIGLGGGVSIPGICTLTGISNPPRCNVNVPARHVRLYAG